MRRNWINQAVNAVKNFYQLAVVKLHHFTAEFSGEITSIHRFETKYSNYVVNGVNAMKLHKFTA